MDVTTLIGLASVIVLLFLWLINKKHETTPPGPRGWPVVGYIPYMSSKPYLDFQKLANIYGPVFSLQLGSQYIIVLNDFQSTKDAFVQDAFMGRPPESPFDVSKESLETEAFIGLPWKEQRRFSLHILKDLGFGKSKLDDMIKEEIYDLLELFEQSDGHPMYIRPLLAPSMSNNIASLVYGKRMKFDDPDRIMLDRVISEFSSQAGQAAWQIFFPWITRCLKFFRFGAEGKLDLLLREMKEYTRKEIKQHEKTLDENNIRDYIDGYLLEIRKRKEKAFCKGVLEDLVGTFFGAGSETVRLVVDWFMLTMAAYEDVQEKIHAEIDSVIGRNRSPNWSDHLKMPYTEATIMEIMRWRTVVPINILRYTLWTTELNGYVIPKGSYVMSNLWAIHHNPEYWGPDAEIFRPERFLSDDCKNIIKSDYYIPFSIGKRSCPGESYAKTEVFLYVVCILQKFKVSLPDGAIPDFEGNLGIGLSPKPYEICIKKR
ncbi:cytochrome P450 2U1 [Nephila pilipes]|uniref:Cytochrome P450 2U1 n=1 Tax=Nephila pilipes TaxID=299642 RepID=A0A8X6QCS9_NEPPI|nr:cytochrome P450 2U1 [Nephila pilipes]